MSREFQGAALEKLQIGAGKALLTSGPTAQTKNLDKRIREETWLSICIADDPLCCVVLGAGKILSDFKLLRKISNE